MIGWFEILNLVGSGAMAGLMTLLAQRMQDRRDEREFLLKRATENRAAIKEAREAKGGYESEASQDKRLTKKIVFLGKRLWEYDYDLIDKGTAVRSTGFHFTRRFLAIVVILSVILLPKVLPVFVDDLSISIGYYETINSWIPWVESKEAIKWITAGVGEKVILISPIEYNICLSIIGLFFGNQVVKR